MNETGMKAAVKLAGNIKKQAEKAESKDEKKNLIELEDSCLRMMNWIWLAEGVCQHNLQKYK